MKTSINQWPVDDRPREKLLKNGEQSLSNAELLAILLRTGTKGQSAIDIARTIMGKFGTFRNMSHTDVRDWKQFKGLGSAKMAQIKAAMEIGRRFREDELVAERKKVRTAKEAVDVLMAQMRDLKTEIFKVMYLDNHSQVIAISDMAKGSVGHACPIVREVLHEALQRFATSIICAHNHPSGNIQPSSNDSDFTKELSNASKTIGIRLLDHVIIGSNQYYSFAENGHLN